MQDDRGRRESTVGSVAGPPATLRTRLDILRYAFLPLAALALAAPALAQSNVRPVPVVGRTARAVYATGDPEEPTRPSDALWEPLAPLGTAAPSRDDLASAPRWDVQMDLEGRLLPATDLETVGGEFSVQRGGWGAALTRQVGSRSYTAYLAADAAFYDWSPASPIVGGTTDPFNDLYETRFGALASFAEDEQIGWFSGFEVIVAGEDDASPLDGLSVGAVSGVRCRANEDLTLTFGLAALTRLEDSAWFLPYFGFDWRLSDTFRLATEGSKLELSAQLTETLEASLSSEYSISQYRLNDAGAVAGGVFRDDTIDATLGLAWQPRAGVTVSLEGGAMLWQESTFLSQGGAKLIEIESGPAPFAGFGLRFDL